MSDAAPFRAEERIAWLRLARSEGVGPLTFAGLIERFGTAAAALAALPALNRRRDGAIRIGSRDEACRELDHADARVWHVLTWRDAAFPSILRTIGGAPPVVCVAGTPALLNRPAVAIVGARNASANGLRFAEILASALGSAGFSIVSGLARGIDGRAHAAALQTGTVAVLAGGLDRIYPPEHAGLFARIVDEGGAVVSEMPAAWVARGRDFPRRNRIVSGLSLGTVVVEAARRSGSLITARLANEQGREVFAVPGSPLDPRAEGTNDLLRQGATLCTAASDVVEALAPLRDVTSVAHAGGSRLKDDPGVDLWALLDGPDDPVAAEQPSATRQDASAILLALLGPVPVGLDLLVQLSGLAAGTVRATLVELELAGTVERTDAGFAIGSAVR
ncbi:DNA-processing protein DprA [Lichenihabitans sp. Uapishka_5]|uniref:DNA-processing protein DprA n=1 Tax=Lichenihabitans sp. Uapishka_5 TaxID=3037302 RepID=UPI0029E7F404|nr:DNA-processing protein DprA [Lichenihabitans sp. Uapishka_5]MDX7953229.1 DNA-processing protein DprA [Lichenihabitans sp. Uapishka_5]